MGPMSSQYIDQYQGLSVPADDRLPWNPWSAKEFQFQQNENYGIWQPWKYFCFENRNNENRQNSQLFLEPKFLSPIPVIFGTDQSMIFQNTFNENRERHLQTSNPPKDGFSRKINRKNRNRHRPRRVIKQIATDTTVNSSENWNHVPVLEWSQSNLPPRSFRNTSFRSRPFNEYNKNPGRFQNSTSNESTAHNFSGTTSKVKAASRANFKSDNNYSTRSTGNTVLSSYAKCLCEANMGGKEKQVNATISNNSENFKEDDDVMYLFSVDSSSEGKMLLEIDLQSDGVNLIPSSPKAQDAKNEDDQSIIIVEELESNKPLTRKRKLSKSNDKTCKRPSYRPRCATCKNSYDDVIAKKQNMFISSSCSHVFCGPCISKDEKSKVCPACEIKFIAFRRLYV